jgi:hypothetical protein
LHPIQPAAERQQIEEERFEVAEFPPHARRLGQRAQLALERRGETLTLIEERREQDERIERLAARLRRRREPPRAVQLAQPQQRLHAKRTRVGEVAAQLLARFFGNEKRQHRRARPLARVDAQVEERIDERIPAAPRGDAGLPRRRHLDRGRKRRGARVVGRAGGGEHERRGTNLLEVHEIAAVGAKRGRASRGHAQQRRVDRFQVRREKPRRAHQREPRQQQLPAGDRRVRRMSRGDGIHVGSVLVCPREMANPR